MVLFVWPDTYQSYWRYIPLPIHAPAVRGSYLNLDFSCQLGGRISRWHGVMFGKNQLRHLWSDEKTDIIFGIRDPDMGSHGIKFFLNGHILTCSVNMDIYKFQLWTCVFQKLIFRVELTGNTWRKSTTTGICILCRFFCWWNQNWKILKDKKVLCQHIDFLDFLKTSFFENFNFVL